MKNELKIKLNVSIKNINEYKQILSDAQDNIRDLESNIERLSNLSLKINLENKLDEILQV